MVVFEFRELGAVVSPLQLARVAGLRTGDLDTPGRRHGEDVGEVILALLVTVLEPPQPPLQVAAAGQDDAGVDLPDRFLLRARVAVLDDAGDVPGRVAQDAPVALGIGQFHGHDLERRGRRIDQGLQRGGPDQGNVRVQDQDRRIVRDARDGLLHGVPGTESLGLAHPIDVPRRAAVPDLDRVRVEDHVDLLRLQGCCGVKNMGDHRPAAHGVQYLGQA